MGTLERFNAKWEKVNGCWLWTASTHKDGYGWFSFEGKMCLAHRISWVLHKGEIPKGMLVCHKCDVRSCVNPEHLWLGTDQDNNSDMMKKKRNKQLKGEKHPNAKLTRVEVERIRTNTTFTEREMAEQLNVSVSTIAKIKSQEIWK